MFKHARNVSTLRMLLCCRRVCCRCVLTAQRRPRRKRIARSLFPAKRSICATCASSPSADRTPRPISPPTTSMLIFQHQGDGVPCDQMYTMPVDTPDGKPATPKLVSTGKGRTTCGYFFPAGDRILYSSTHAASPECPPRPDYSHGYVWPIYSSYKIYTAKLDGSDIEAADRCSRLQRRIDHQPRRQENRLHLHAQRRPRHLHHERRRHAT